ncbi:MAG: glycosyltransferase family 2 protein [Bulleidia sp.]|nr:glycosyltransferase family 2 protein [Bulleidia sp.]
MTDYSFVIPCYDSAKTITGVVEEINKAMSSIDGSFDIVLVNDASPKDNTKEVIFNLAKQYDNITAVSFAKNFGQHAALMAGLRYSDGNYVICMDDDGQTPASEVSRLIDKLNEGYDVVFARYNVKHHSSFRNFGSRVNDYMARKLINKPKELYMSSYFIARRYVIDEVCRYQGPFPYISGLLLRTTSNVTNVEIDHRSRESGESGYTFSKLLKLWLNGFTAFSVKPLRFSALCGCVISLIGLIVTIYALVNKFTNPDAVVGWTSLIGVISLVGGAILLTLGLTGEYIGRIYIHINNSPQYVIRDCNRKETVNGKAYEEQK